MLNTLLFIKYEKHCLNNQKLVETIKNYRL